MREKTNRRPDTLWGITCNFNFTNSIQITSNFNKREIITLQLSHPKQ